MYCIQIVLAHLLHNCAIGVCMEVEVQWKLRHYILNIDTTQCH